MFKSIKLRLFALLIAIFGLSGAGVYFTMDNETSVTKAIFLTLAAFIVGVSSGIYTTMFSGLPSIVNTVNPLGENYFYEAIGNKVLFSVVNNSRLDMESCSVKILATGVRILDGKNYEISEIVSVSKEPAFISGSGAHPTFMNRSLICIVDPVEVGKILSAGYIDVSLSWSWRLGNSVYSKRYVLSERKTI